MHGASEDPTQVNEQISMWSRQATSEDAEMLSAEEEEQAAMSRGATDWTAPLTWYGKQQFDVQRLLEGVAVPPKWYVGPEHMLACHGCLAGHQCPSCKRHGG